MSYYLQDIRDTIGAQIERHIEIKYVFVERFNSQSIEWRTRLKSKSMSVPYRLNSETPIVTTVVALTHTYLCSCCRSTGFRWGEERDCEGRQGNRHWTRSRFLLNHWITKTCQYNSTSLWGTADIRGKNSEKHLIWLIIDEKS